MVIFPLLSFTDVLSPFSQQFHHKKIFSKGLHKITPEIYQMNYKKQQL